tara:strand:+ start:166 stop:1293 length:1128 start_codon:yes stop_codon:yes gene_type:complete
MLLEEAVLYILSFSGYTPIIPEDHNEGHFKGDKLKGRGTVHQVDAIGECWHTPAFGHQQRLLVEAKMKSKNGVGLDVVCKSKAVLDDVNQFWNSKHRKIGLKRYHYQYAIFTTDRFSGPAQDFAYAHDLFLVPMSEHAGLSGLITAIRKAAQTIDERWVQSPEGKDPDKSFPLKAYREFVRKELGTRTKDNMVLISTYVNADDFINDADMSNLVDFVKACHQLPAVWMGTIFESVPILLVSEPGFLGYIQRSKGGGKFWENIEEVDDDLKIHLIHDHEKELFYLESYSIDESPRVKDDKVRVFSFSLPMGMIMNMRSALEADANYQPIKFRHETIRDDVVATGNIPLAKGWQAAIYAAIELYERDEYDEPDEIGD